MYFDDGTPSKTHEASNHKSELFLADSENSRHCCTLQQHPFFSITTRSL